MTHAHPESGEQMRAGREPTRMMRFAISGTSRLDSRSLATGDAVMANRCRRKLVRASSSSARRKAGAHLK